MVEQRSWGKGVLVLVAERCAESLLDCIDTHTIGCWHRTVLPLYCVQQRRHMCMSNVLVTVQANIQLPLGSCKRNTEDRSIDAIQLQPGVHAAWHSLLLEGHLSVLTSLCSAVPLPFCAAVSKAPVN